MGAIFLTPYGGVPVTPKLGLEKNHLILTQATYPETMKAPLKNAANGLSEDDRPSTNYTCTKDIQAKHKRDMEGDLYVVR